jgi:predicted extracellular nuclease
MSKYRQLLNSCCNSGAALLGLLLVSACTDTGVPANLPASLCQADSTLISTIQGDEYYSPLKGQAVTTRGTVTWVSSDEGVYIEDVTSPPLDSHSRALFVSDKSLGNSVAPGHLLAISGQVAELGSSRDKMTSLTNISGFEICSETSALHLTEARLPMNSSTRETLEGMQVSFGQPLTVTDVYKLSDGELTVSGSGVLRIPTEVVMPGTAAARREAENRNLALVVSLPAAIHSPLPVGAIFNELNGLMGHNGRTQQLFLQGEPGAETPGLDIIEPAMDQQVRVVNSNLLNFFNGDGKGGGFPTERGAKNQAEFLAQSARTQAAMARIQPDLLAVQELENDGFGTGSAAQSLLVLLNNSGHGDWAFIEAEAGHIGGDVITVGLFHRQQVLEAVGAPQTLASTEFRGLSRQPLAQLFRDRRTGVEFLVAANHLKSKGSCPDDGTNADQDDGQGCWNPARASAVTAELEWIDRLSESLGTKNILIMGDMNAWRQEDPIRKFLESSWVDLVEHLSGLPQYSFLYWGQTGTLDYVFASDSMSSYARSAVIWHINANRARNMEHPQPWLRASDHDPVIVDFDFSQASTSD